MFWKNRGMGRRREDPLLKPLLAARERLFSILQNRTYPMDQRMAAALKFAERLDPPVRQEDTEEILKLAGTDPESWLKAAGTERSWYGSRQEILELLETYRDLESLDGTWGGRMESLMEQLPELLEQRRVFLEAFRNREYEYEHLAVYVLYRYFMESLFDGCVLPPVSVCGSQPSDPAADGYQALAGKRRVFRGGPDLYGETVFQRDRILSGKHGSDPAVSGGRTRKG